MATASVLRRQRLAHVVAAGILGHLVSAQYNCSRVCLERQFCDVTRGECVDIELECTQADRCVEYLLNRGLIDYHCKEVVRVFNRADGGGKASKSKLLCDRKDTRKARQNGPFTSIGNSGRVEQDSKLAEATCGVPISITDVARGEYPVSTSRKT